MNKSYTYTHVHAVEKRKGHHGIDQLPLYPNLLLLQAFIFVVILVACTENLPKISQAICRRHAETRVGNRLLPFRVESRC